MSLLAFSTSVDKGSLALSILNKTLCSNWDRSKSHSEVLTAKIEQIFKKSKTGISSIRGVALDLGPGSFTGCRISAGVAKTISYSLNIPIFTATSLSVMAYNHYRPKMQITSLLDAHRGWFYWQNFLGTDGVLRAMTKVQVAKTEQVEGICEGSQKIVGWLPGETQLPSTSLRKKFEEAWPQAKTLLQMISDRSPLVQEDQWQGAEPLYVRAPPVVEKLLNLNF